MSTSLSSLVDNLSEIYSKKCKDENCKSECDFIGLKINRLRYKCKECKKIWLKPANGLIKKFPSVYQFCKGNLNKFVLLLRKGVYPYEYMVSWEKFDETSLPDKEAFYSKLNEEGISNIDYAHAQKVWEVFGIKNNLGEYHDLCFQCNTLLLVDVFENFRDKCIEIYKLDPAYFVSSPGLAWQAFLKKTGVKLELLTDIDMMLILEKVKGGICQVIHRYAKGNNKYGAEL